MSEMDIKRRSRVENNNYDQRNKATCLLPRSVLIYRWGAYRVSQSSYRLRKLSNGDPRLG
jgi:hypothetical protein